VSFIGSSSSRIDPARPAISSSSATVSDSTQVSARFQSQRVSYSFIHCSTPNGRILIGESQRVRVLWGRSPATEPPA
jgi:hypothetical protein